MKKVGDRPPSDRQMVYLRDLLKGAHVDEIARDKIIKQCVSSKITSYQIQQALKMKKEYDDRLYGELLRNASKRRQN